MHLIGEYIKYKLNSKGKHDIHSPFVFDFICKCLKIPIQKEDLSKINELKQKYTTNTNKITILDMGQGSKKLGSVRKINQIFKTAASKGNYAKLLYQLSKHYHVKNVLEFGTSLAYGTLHFALGNKEVNITSIDACSETQNIAKKEFELLNIDNINFVNASFDDFINNLANQHEIPSFDLVFIDGHHNGEALLKYLNSLDKHTHDETIFVLDDIRWSEDMLAAWEKICSDSTYHLTMDLFRMGICLKRKHQAKEHFIIKMKNVLKGMI